jgi:hypothetical protein
VFGLSLSADDTSDVTSLDIDLDAMSREILQSLPAAEGEDLAMQLSFDRIPVRRSLVDKLLFRSAAALRRKLFGAAETLQVSVSHRVKEKRLGPEARTALIESAAAEFLRHLDQAEEESGAGRLKMFVTRSANTIETRLTELERQLIRDKNELTSTAEKLDCLDATFSRLGEVARDVSAAVGRLEEKHGPKVKSLLAIAEVVEPVDVPVRGDSPASDVFPEDGDEDVKLTDPDVEASTEP